MFFLREEWDDGGGVFGFDRSSGVSCEFSSSSSSSSSSMSCVWWTGGDGRKGDMEDPTGESPATDSRSRKNCGFMRAAGGRRASRARD